MTINRMKPLTLLLAVAPMFVGCSSSYLVLLEDHDGSTGQVVFKSADGETVLDRAGSATRIDRKGDVFQADQKQIESDFGRALGSEPVRPEVYLLYFETGGTRLTAESAAQLPKIIESASRHPAADISIIGHTDTVGAAADNETLAKERAEQVAKLFGAGQLDVKEIAVTSHGEKNPLVKTADETPEPKNRRVEVTIR
ncbi:OmpA family protein [Methylomonas sp. UP202]|uniref:OmpA family protein n=1 Tax=Methylomonas sp. UP202 TaxID=3040943 RepID=UPI0024797DA3|nr:OmpA family protein [Methylomonas sp. UP202]WGS84125.1 OmpA family protein [Methylomonas sp. UP202]